MTRLTQCSREGRTAPPPRFFPLLKPCTPASLKSNFYAPSVLLPPAPLTRRYCLRMNQVSGQQKARRRDSQGHSIREGPGLLRAHGAQRLRASAQDHSTRERVRPIPGRPRLRGQGGGSATGTPVLGAGPQATREMGRPSLSLSAFPRG